MPRANPGFCGREAVNGGGWRLKEGPGRTRAVVRVVESDGESGQCLISGVLCSQRDQRSRLYISLPRLCSFVFVWGCFGARTRATAAGGRLGLARLLGEVVQLRFDEIDEVVDDDGRIQRPQPPPAVEGLPGHFEAVADGPR